MTSEKSHVLDRIGSLGLLAVIRGPSVEATLSVVDALVRGGLCRISP